MKPDFVSIAVGILALAYFLFPIDAIPDPIPLLGLLDDLAVAVGAIWTYIKRNKKVTR